jgi:GT2 family glycosyltransferase
MGEPAFSIIVVTKSLSNENLFQMMDSTSVLGRSFEIIIIFSEKVQNAKEIITVRIKGIKHLAKIRAVSLDEDKGLTYSRNLGAVLADSHILVFADDDIVLVEDISPLVDFLENGICQALQPLILRFSDPSIVDSAGDNVRFINGIYHARMRFSGEKLSSIQKTLCIDQITSTRGAFMMFEKNALLKVGGFDNSFCFNLDDVDIGWRMTISGFKILFVPTIRVLHRGGRTTNSSKIDRRVLQFWAVNFHALQLKVGALRFWPLIIGRFLFFSVAFQIKHFDRTSPMSLNDFFSVYRMFGGRFVLIFGHRKILGDFNYCGKKTFDRLASGQPNLCLQAETAKHPFVS